MADIKADLRRYILENYFRGEAGSHLDDSTSLITSGLIDSIGVIGLINFIESRFDIEFMPREIGLHNLETVEQIHDAIQKKLETKAL